MGNFAAVKMITHAGVEILSVDYSQCKNQREMKEVLFEATDFIRNFTRKLYVLIDFSDCFIGPDIMNQAKKFHEEVYIHKVRYAAVLGVSGVKKILLNGFNVVAKNRMKAFSKREDALTYLQRPAQAEKELA